MDYRKIPLSANLSPPDERDFPITKLTLVKATYPDDFLIPYKHDTKNQVEYPLCVSFSLSYCRETLEEKQTGEYTELSPFFVDNNRYDTDYQGEGWHPREALNHLLKEGICSRKVFPYEGTYPALKSEIQTNSKVYLKDAYPRRISAYARLHGDDQIRSALMQLGPVTAIIRITPEFYNITKSNPIMPMYSNLQQLLGYHEITIFGWTKKFGSLHYIALNSWGREWGEDGWFYIPFALELDEAWSITDNVLPEKPILPVKNAVVTYPYGVENERYKAKGYHMGIDFYGDHDILSTGSGTVLLVGWDPEGWGNFIVIRSGDGKDIIYAHLSSVLVKQSQQVEQGAKIGVMGTTGNSTGIHLHYEVRLQPWTDKNEINPAEYLGIKNEKGTEVKKLKHLVLYGGYDNAAADLLAHALQCPTMHVERFRNVPIEAENIYMIGGNIKPTTNTILITGLDRYATMQAVLNFIGGK